MEKTKQLPELMTRAEVAEVLGLRPQTLARWAMSGRHLPTIKIGSRAVRYRAADVAKLLDVK